MTGHNFYRGRIQQALEFIDVHLCENFSAADVASAAHFSEYHFHRLFAAFTGESINHYVRSRRLEKAATSLKAKADISLTQLALAVGFETPSAFSRAFKQHFGLSPSQFKSGIKPLVNKPLRAAENRPYLKTQSHSSLELPVTVQNLDTCYLQYRIAKGVTSGSFFVDEDLSILFTDLAKYKPFAAVSAYPASPNGLNDENIEVWYGGLFRNGEFKNGEFRNEGFNEDELKKEKSDSWSQHQYNFSAGDWAVFQYRGSYAYLHQAWSQLYCVWLPDSTWLLRDELPFEMYLNSPQQVNDDQLLTEIWLPVQKG